MLHFFNIWDEEWVKGILLLSFFDVLLNDIPAKYSREDLFC